MAETLPYLMKVGRSRALSSASHRKVLLGFAAGLQTAARTPE
jgi:hypothetical protein